MSEPFEIFRGVPIPPVRRPKTGRTKWPVDKMEVGDIIFVPGRSSRSVSAYVARITKDLPGEYLIRGCWMRPGQGREPKWVLADEGQKGAKEGTGVWRTK